MDTARRILCRMIWCMLVACMAVPARAAESGLTEEGVSLQLARHRHATIHGLRYSLYLDIPQDVQQAVQGHEVVTFDLDAPDDIVLDFRESADHIHGMWVRRGRQWRACAWHMVNDHIVIPRQHVHRGTNHVRIDFTAGNQSLNRRQGYVYTLFVPDRARTVFPCFEQPNLKATFQLTLQIPEPWRVACNGPEQQKGAPLLPAPSVKPGKRLHHSAIDRPIPTYLFAFAAGDFQYQRYHEDGISIGAYHRETDSMRVAQLPAIMHQVVFSLRWQEEFTGVKYPFPKYDLVILPGFQFGGMEHVGATFYNDNTIFLPPNPTPDEELRRTELISHETSHMWFGDAVTMDWFDDVWTKEVFANYFAAEITEPLFPTLNHSLNWLKTYVNAAISQDRTSGRTSIRQPLDNLRYAGLVYNNIIYNKAPVMMRQMVKLMGRDAFRRGIRRYVQTYLYGNATWPDLIRILDSETPVDLQAFSRQWVDEVYWPHRHANTWMEARDAEMYGFIELSAMQTDSVMAYWPRETDGTARQAMLMNLNENFLNGKIDSGRWLQFLHTMLMQPWDELTYMALVGYMREPLVRIAGISERAEAERMLWQTAQTHASTSVRKQMIRLLAARAESPATVDSLCGVWKQVGHPLLSDLDYMTLAYEMAVRKPAMADSILRVQRARIANPDRLARFDFTCRAVSASAQVRDSLFASLHDARNRRIEPWTLDVLYYLNHPLRQRESLHFIDEALEMLPDIQRTGDIFFPGNWCANLLAGHRSAQALAIVQQFLQRHQHDYPPLLLNKVRQAMYHLENQQNIK